MDGGWIPPTEFEERRASLIDHARRNGLTGCVLFGADYIRYFTGFAFLSNERPVVYAESIGGESTIFVPEFEVERTRAEATFARIDAYPEYPGLEHPMRIFARVLADIGVERRNAWSWLMASMRGVAVSFSGAIGLKMLSNSTPPTRFADS